MMQLKDLPLIPEDTLIWMTLQNHPYAETYRLLKELGCDVRITDSEYYSMLQEIKRYE